MFEQEEDADSWFWKDEGLYCDVLDMLEKEKDIDDDVREEEDIVCFWKDDDFAIDM